MSSPKKLKFKQSQSESFFKVFASGVLGGMNPNKCNILFFNDNPEINTLETGRPKIEFINRELLGEVTVTPVQFKQMAVWMNRNVDAYEKKFGKIQLRPEDKSQPPNFIT